MQQDYDKLRNGIFTRTQRLLAEPVGQLVATAFEPRVSGDVKSTSFDNIVEAKQNILREELKGRTRRDGGAIEVIAREIANSLLTEAEQQDLQLSVKLLRDALDFCEGREKSSSVDRGPLPQPERVIGSSGKPIGLWR